jgi:prephenate dehydrogenase
MWHDISLANSDALLHRIDQFSAHLQQLRDAIAAADSDQIMEVFSNAKSARDRFADTLLARSGKLNAQE